ncbi:MAG: phospholipase D-like domain-containing protein [Novosphingobium sp.]
MVEDPDGKPQTVWRYARAARAHVVVDCAAYFELMHEAMLNAHERIFLIGWDFDSRIRLAGGRRWWNLPRKERFPARLGAFFVWLVKRNRGLRIRTLKWNFGALRMLFRGTMIIDLIRWYINRRIEFVFDGAHPIGCSHHQKIVVIDDTFAACGGIDMTSDRWDTPDHLHEDSRRRRPTGTHYPPWHDMSVLLEGEAALALAELGRERWERADGSPMPPCLPRDGTAWPDRLSAEFRDVEVGIARTRAAYAGTPEVREVEALFLDHVARARRFFYAESQYFASRSIAEAIALRLSEPDPPEFIIITSKAADGWLAQATMDTARERLLHSLHERDHARRLRVYTPVTSGGADIYVHAKLAIVDDEVLRVGSANMNNRSMGLDTEADVVLDAARPGNAHIVPAITGLRQRMLAEHCGVSRQDMQDYLETHGTMAKAIAAATGKGKRLVPFVLRQLTDAEKAMADSALFDPESPAEFFEPMGRRRGLFRRGGILRRPR